jgi:hypothetical protein
MHEFVPFQFVLLREALLANRTDKRLKSVTPLMVFPHFGATFEALGTILQPPNIQGSILGQSTWILDTKNEEKRHGKEKTSSGQGKS